MKTLFIFFLLVTGYWLLVTNVSAQEITILYTGSTHAMLYPCSCPKEQDGGIARRATLIKQFKKSNPNILLLDSGGFFGAGLMDEHTQNTELDRERTLVNLRAMELMKYDALNISSDEFNFGRSFFQENAGKTNLAFLSCNISNDGFSFIKPYIIKEISGIKVGIIGVTDLLAVRKAEGLKITEPIIALKKAVGELRKNPINIVVLLSYLTENENLNLINNIEGIDIIISAHPSKKEGVSYEKIGKTLLLASSWQGRKIGTAIITVKDNKIASYKVEELRLSDKIQDDPQIIPILPRCFQDANCKKEGVIGVCQNPGRIDSHCSFEKSNKIGLLIVTSKACRICETETLVKLLKRDFPGLVVSYEYYPGRKANNLIKEFSISGLPAYLLAKEVEKDKKFEGFKRNLVALAKGGQTTALRPEAKADFYMLRPEFSGIAYFINRSRIDKKLDLFISLFDKDTKALLDMIREFNPQIHFLAIEREDEFEAAGGILEVEEYLRATCVQKHEPEKFWDYISCRAQNFKSSWWDNCAVNMDLNKLKECAKGSEGVSLLRENISLNKELKVMFGPTYLVDNQETFATKGAPSKEELRKIIKR